MIGIWALIIDLGFIVLPLGMGWLAYLDWRTSKSKRDIFGLVFISLFLLVCGNKLAHHLSYYHELRAMSVDAVSFVEIDGRSISETKDLTSLINALNEAEWFSYNHGGAARRVPFVIHFKSGRESRYSVGYFLREEGAVIEFNRRWKNGALVSYGEAFCRKLPQALAQAGAPLPHD